ncbi:MAG: hypothetical protein NTV21_16155 [Planctomycetota bacterium]|nr:hypothetical protein [Planctomycetota bacterium]
MQKFSLFPLGPRGAMGCFLLGACCAVGGFAALTALLDFLSRSSPTAPDSTPFGNTHYFRALAAEDQNQPDAAIREWRALEADGWGEVSTRHLVERLKDQRRYEEALETVDRNKPNLSEGDYEGIRIGLLEQWKGQGAVIAWLKELDAQDPTPFRIRDLGEYLLHAGRPQEALEPLFESVQRTCALHGYRFDEQDQLVDVRPPPTPGADSRVRREYRYYLGALPLQVQFLAMAHEAVGDDDQALRWATRDVLVCQRLKAFDGTDEYGNIKGGSLAGRMIRARVYLRRGQLEEAGVELDFAAQMTASHEAEHQLRLDEAFAQLAKLRAEER